MISFLLTTNIMEGHLIAIHASRKSSCLQFTLHPSKARLVIGLIAGENIV